MKRHFKVSWTQHDRVFFRFFVHRSTALRLFEELRCQGWREAEVRDMRTSTVIAPE